MKDALDELLKAQEAALESGLLAAYMTGFDDCAEKQPDKPYMNQTDGAKMREWVRRFMSV